MPWKGIHHVHYAIPMNKEEETLNFWTEVMGFDVITTIDRPDGRKVISLSDGTDSHVYLFSIDFEDSDHVRRSVMQTSHEWMDKDEFEWLEEDVVADARKWIVGFHHLAWAVDSTGELEPIKAKLDEHDIPYRVFNRHNVAISLYFPEPINGINLEVYSPGPDPKYGELSDLKYRSESEAMQTTDKLKEGHEVKSEGIVRAGSNQGIAKILKPDSE